MLKLLVIFLAIQSVYCRKRFVKTHPTVNWTEGVFNCEDVPDSYMDTKDLHLEKLGPDDITMAGVLRILREFPPPPLPFVALIYKKYATEYEYFFRFQKPDICNVIHTTKINFWDGIVKQMNLTGCPFLKMNHTIERIDIPINPENYDFLRSVLGDYKIRVEFLSKGKIFACYIAYVAVTDE